MKKPHEQDDVRSPRAVGRQPARRTGLATANVATLLHALQPITDEARNSIGAHQAAIHIAVGGDWSLPITAVSFSEKYSAWRDLPVEKRADGLRIEWAMGPILVPMCFTHHELIAHPFWKSLSKSSASRPPLCGWLAAPLFDRHGQNIGTIELSEKQFGEFNDDDLAWLVRVARIVSLAIENTLVCEADMESVQFPGATAIGQSGAVHAVDEPNRLLARSCLADLRSEHAILVSNADGAIADWNDDAQKCFGYTRAEIIGKSIAALVPPERGAEHYQMVSQVARGQTASVSETVRIRKGGAQVIVSLALFPLRDAAGQVVGAVTIARDLTELVALEQQFRQAQKMEIFGQLAGGVAHDFNNLLTIILGYTEIIIKRLTHGDPLRELVGEIQKASQRAETLTRQLLAFSRQETLEAKVLDLNAAVSDTEKMLRRLLGEDILMTTIFAPTLNAIKIDPGHLQQVILNLAVNARDAMPKGGSLTIKTENVVVGENDAIGNPLVHPGEYVLLSISDTGTGMDDATIARIFTPLFTTKGPSQGTGLGLTTVDGIVQQYGGHIEVQSRPGAGSTFNVFFPALADSAAIRKSHPHLRMIPRGKETVLLVEDEDSVRSLVRQVLLACGYVVLEATNGEEAIQLVEQYSGPIDLLVSDVVMPHLGGRPLADRLLALKPRLKILFLSGYTNDAVQRHGISDSDFAFLQKPFTTGAFAQKVRDVLDQLPQKVGA